MGLLAEGESPVFSDQPESGSPCTAAIRAHYLYQRNVHYIIMMVK
jgi:preprotein translocase subunit SecA